MSRYSLIFFYVQHTLTTRRNFSRENKNYVWNVFLSDVDWAWLWHHSVWGEIIKKYHTPYNNYQIVVTWIHLINTSTHLVWIETHRWIHYLWDTPGWIWWGLRQRQGWRVVLHATIVEAKLLHKRTCWGLWIMYNCNWRLDMMLCVHNWCGCHHFLCVWGVERSLLSPQSQKNSFDLFFIVIGYFACLYK